MPVEGNDPNATRTDGAPETPDTRPAEAVTVDATIEQLAPPAWALSGNSSGSNASRSGKDVYELDREIERSQATGAADAADGYTLIRKLGTGSFGAVWEAEDRLTGERVAIKFFTAGDADWEKLLGEVGLLQAVEGCHGIVMVKQVRPGGNGRRPHYVMQLANGGSLADWLKTASALSPRERVRQAASFFIHTARAMAAVHRRGIHHCDLKPHNILLHSAEPNLPPEPLVADFGQAHLATDDTPALGTFFYMPPDQIDAAQSGTPPDTRWDVYALGAVMYEMLTGAPPRHSSELIDRIKKSPKHLPTRLSVYRDGLLEAAKPQSHRGIADPMLAKIIDRCLSLRPDRRPPDAGSLVALLDKRAQWRRIRPLLGLAAFATFLVIALVIVLGLWAANAVTERTKTNVTADVAGSLSRTAGYGTRAIEDRLQRYVVSLDQWALDAHEKDPRAIAALKTASNIPRGPTLKGKGGSLSPEGLQAVREWLARLHQQRKVRVGPDDHMPSLGVMMVADDALGGGTQSRGYYVARVQSDGHIEDVNAYTSAHDREMFTRDFSYRDYFHAGPCEAPDIEGPHRVVRAAHISHPFRSRGVDRTESGASQRERWKMNIVTPIWSNPQSHDRVIGLLVLGLDIEYDIVPLLYPAEFARPATSAGYGIDRSVKVVVADHRGRWVWHPDSRNVLNSDSPDVRNPHSYPELTRKYGLSDEQSGPWLTLTKPVTDHGYGESDQYVDAVELELDGDREPEIACFARFDPYERSRYHGQDATGAPASPRQWIFVAQVDRKTALHPLDQMKKQILRGGVIVVGSLTFIAVGLWVGLVVVLRRLEFVSHG